MLNHRQKRTDEQIDHECDGICFVSGGHGMAERRRGTQGRPMIYGKSPESRRYWNITPEDQKTLPNSKAGVNDTATEKDPAAEQKRRASEKLENGKNAGERIHLHRKTNTKVKKKAADGLTETKRPKAENQAATKRGRRARSYGERTKLRMLWAAFGVLCVLLVAAIIYEIVLGNGTKLPGSERITLPTRQEQNKATTGITLQKKQTEAVQAETAAQTEMTAQSETAVQSEMTAQTETAVQNETTAQTGELSGGIQAGDGAGTA